jgi:hypothetical protein
MTDKPIPQPRMIGRPLRQPFVLDKPLPHPPYSDEYVLPKTKYGIPVRPDQFVSLFKVSNHCESRRKGFTQVLTIRGVSSSCFQARVPTVRYRMDHFTPVHVWFGLQRLFRCLQEQRVTPQHLYLAISPMTQASANCISTARQLLRIQRSGC